MVDCIAALLRDRRWCHLARYMDIILSKFAEFEAEWLLQRPVPFSKQFFGKFDDAECVYDR